MAFLLTSCMQHFPGLAFRITDCLKIQLFSLNKKEKPTVHMHLWQDRVWYGMNIDTLQDPNEVIQHIPQTLLMLNVHVFISNSPHKHALLIKKNQTRLFAITKLTSHCFWSLFQC
jgi:hypothetical protein